MLKNPPQHHQSSEHYSQQVGWAHRSQWGQFFTAPSIAEFMVKWLLASNPDCLYDPAFGLGAFYHAAQALDYTGQFAGCEVDTSILAHFYTLPNKGKLTIAQRDYFSAWDTQHSAIVCNPPYQRFQKCLNRSRIFAQLGARLNVQILGHTNIASAFLLKSINELRSGGRLAYLMPLEFLNTRYGQTVKQSLLSHGTLKALIKIDCEQQAFADVTTSLGIILFEKTARNTATNFYVVKHLDELKHLLETPAVTCPTRLHVADKWAQYFSAPQRLPLRGVPLAEYGRFKRGIASGANHYFVLKPEQARTLKLSAHETIPCITKSAQLKKPVLRSADVVALHAQNAPILLLNLDDTLSPAARAYIAHGEALGVHRRFLTQSRTPWYRREQHLAAPILFGVFSRAGFKVIRNHSDARHLTCYHGFFPNALGARYVEHIFLYLLSKVGQQIVSCQMRYYGKALNKFEPNDLNAALCPDVAWFEDWQPDKLQQELAYLEIHGKLSDGGEAHFTTLLDSGLIIGGNTHNRLN